jgi:hypothetical protein
MGSLASDCLAEPDTSCTIVEFQMMVLPDNSRDNVSGRNGERHLVLTRLQQRSAELLDVLVPRTLIGVVAQGIGCDRMQRAGAPIVEANGRVPSEARFVPITLA